MRDREAEVSFQQLALTRLFTLQCRREIVDDLQIACRFQEQLVEKPETNQICSGEVEKRVRGGFETLRSSEVGLLEDACKEVRQRFADLLS